MPILVTYFSRSNNSLRCVHCLISALTTSLFSPGAYTSTTWRSSPSFVLAFRSTDQRVITFPPLLQLFKSSIIVFNNRQLVWIPFMEHLFLHADNIRLDSLYIHHFNGSVRIVYFKVHNILYPSVSLASFLK